MTEDRLLPLIIGRMSGELGAAEALELDLWVREGQGNAGLVDVFINDEKLQMEIGIFQAIDPARGFANWMDHRRRERKLLLSRIGVWAVAACLLIAIVKVIVLCRPPATDSQSVAVTKASQPIQPGKSSAELTLNNGERILLDTSGKGEVAKQGNSRVTKTDTGSLRYDELGKTPMTTAFNTLTTPRSGQYHLTLADGSQVWLNNASNLRYPTAFSPDNRKVELSGEAYFEIAKDAHKPFIVKMKDERVEVLGTSFNVSAYADEAGARTTLINGSVRITAGKTIVQLHPDEQARVDASGRLIIVKRLPARDIAAWKDGFFYFGHDLKEIMRQLSRWYDVEIRYVGKVPNADFNGKVDRNINLDELIKFFDKYKIHLQLKGRIVYVSPN